METLFWSRTKGTAVDYVCTYCAIIFVANFLRKLGSEGMECRLIYKELSGQELGMHAG
jgi:hypothetical protein